MMNNYVRIFDTTLRDGEQSPGATMTSAEKLEVARCLARLGVDVIEAGFPAASPDDLEAVRRIALEVGNPPTGEPDAKVPVICGLARATKGDIDKAWEAVKGAQNPRIHTFLATSDIHMQYKLNMTREQVVERVQRDGGLCPQPVRGCGVPPEDAGRSDPEFLYQVLDEAIKAGRNHAQYPRYGRLHHARRVRRADRRDHQEHARHRESASSPSTATTTWGWRPPTRWPASTPARARPR